MTSLEPYALRVEHLTTPLGLDEPRPRFAWRLRSTTDGSRQRAYRLVVSAGGHTWDTGKVDSAEQLEIAYAGHPLQPYTRYTWTVQVWDDEDQPSEPVQSWFETGRLNRPWVARWIGRDTRDR